MGILNRWRQFGRRYFWPHLLLGVVAASLGLSSNLPNASQQSVASSTAASSLNRLSDSVQGVITPGLWLEFQRQSSQSFNPWQKQAIRRFLTRLALALPPRAAKNSYSTLQQAEEASYTDWALFDTLTKLLADNTAPAFTSVPTSAYGESAFSQQGLGKNSIGLWLAKSGGIRAGPHYYG